MTDHAEQTPAQEPVAQETLTEPVTPAGEILRAAREAAGLTLDEVAERFKLRKAQVEALEASDWKSLPGSTFVRGMVRSYARLLNLDPEPLLEHVEPAAKAAPTATIIPSSTPPSLATAPRSERPRRDWGVSLLGVVFLGLAALIYVLLPDNNELVQPAAQEPVIAPVTADGQPAAAEAATTTVPSTVPEVAEKPAAVVAPVPAPAPAGDTSAQNKPAVTGGSNLHLSFTAPTWVEVRDASGTVIFNETGRAGVERDVSGKAPLSLHIGNAAGVSLQYKGKPVDMEPFVRNNIGRVRLD